MSIIPRRSREVKVDSVWCLAGIALLFVMFVAWFFEGGWLDD